MTSDYWPCKKSCKFLTYAIGVTWRWLRTNCFSKEGRKEYWAGSSDLEDWRFRTQPSEFILFFPDDSYQWYATGFPPIPRKEVSRRCQTFSPDCPDRGSMYSPLFWLKSNYISRALVGSPGSGKNSFRC